MMSKSLNSRRRILKLLAGTAPVALLAACAAPQAAAPAAQPAAPAATAAPKATEAPAAATEAPKPTEAPAAAKTDAGPSRAETLIFGSDTTDAISLDPAVAYEFSGIQAEASTYETLVSPDPGKPGVKPVLAESWEAKEDGDMLTFTFKLNAKAKFASGKPVTAEDVMYSWSRAIELNKSPAFLLTDIIGLKKENMSTPDVGTFVVKIPKATGQGVFLSTIGFTVAAVVEKAVVEANKGADMGSTWLNDHSAGSGPYTLTKWEREVQIVLDANPNYWGTPAPSIKRVILQNIKDAANRLSAIETGDADIVQDLSPEQKKSLEGNADVKVISANNTQLIYIGMNAQKAPLDNVDVRQAIRYAINYDEIIALTKGDAKLVQEVIPDGFLGNDGKNPFKQDIAKAKELLAKAGVKEGTEIEALVPSDYPAGPIDFPTLATKVQSDLAKVGITLKLKQMQVSELLGVYRKQAGNIVFILWGPDFADPHANAGPFSDYAAKSIAWRNGYENKEIAALAYQAASAPTDAERIALYAKFNERMLNEGPYAVLYQPLRTFGVRANVGGFLFDPNDTPSLTFAAMSKK